MTEEVKHVTHVTVEESALSRFVDAALKAASEIGRLRARAERMEAQLEVYEVFRTLVLGNRPVEGFEVDPVHAVTHAVRDLKMHPIGDVIIWSHADEAPNWLKHWKPADKRLAYIYYHNNGTYLMRFDEESGEMLAWAELSGLSFGVQEKGEDSDKENDDG